MRIGDLDVKVLTITSDRKSSMPEGVGRLYISSSYDNDYRISSLNKMASAKYVIFGSPELILFISMVLNSYAGYVQMKDFGQNPKITISSIKNIVVPNVDFQKLGAGAIIDYYEGLLNEVLNKMDEAHEDFLEMKVLQQFLNLIHKYFVEQLYLPNFFESHNLDIVSIWSKICVSQNEKLEELHKAGHIGYLKNLMDSLLGEEKKLFEIFNKMKVFQVETHRMLSQNLNPNYLPHLG